MSKSFFITRKNGDKYEVIVDDDRYEEIMCYKWFLAASGTGKKYVARSVSRRQYMLHWQIIGKPPVGIVTDHINGNGLDNRACNLRHCTRSENSRNTKKCKKD